jgi:hypothetical protein
MFYDKMKISYDEECLEKAKEELRREDPYWYQDNKYSLKLKSRYTEIQRRALLEVGLKSDSERALVAEVVPRVPREEVVVQETIGLEERDELWTDQVVSYSDGIYVMKIGKPVQGRSSVKLFEYSQGVIHHRCSMVWVFPDKEVKDGYIVRSYDRYVEMHNGEVEWAYVQTHSKHSRGYKEYHFARVDQLDPMREELLRQPLFVLPKKFVGVGGDFCPIPAKVLFVSSIYYRHEGPLLALVEVVHSRIVKTYLRTVVKSDGFSPNEVVTAEGMVQFLQGKISEGFLLFTCFTPVEGEWAKHFVWWLPPHLDHEQVSVDWLEKKVPERWKMQCTRLRRILREDGIMSYLDPLTKALACYYQWKGWHDTIIALAWIKEWKPFYRGKGKKPDVIYGTYIEFPNSMQYLVTSKEARSYFLPVLEEVQREISRKTLLGSYKAEKWERGKVYRQEPIMLWRGEPMMGCGQMPVIKFPIDDFQSPAQRISRMCPLFKPVHYLFKHGKKRQWTFEATRSWCRHHEFCGCQLYLIGPVKQPLPAVGDSLTSQMYFLLMSLLKMIYLTQPRLVSRVDTGSVMLEVRQVDWESSGFDAHSLHPGNSFFHQVDESSYSPGVIKGRVGEVGEVEVLVDDTVVATMGTVPLGQPVPEGCQVIGTILPGQDFTISVSADVKEKKVVPIKEDVS